MLFKTFIMYFSCISYYAKQPTEPLEKKRLTFGTQTAYVALEMA